MNSALEDVHLPKDNEFTNWQAFKNFFNMTNTELDVIDFVFERSNELNFIKGKKKTDKDALEPFHNLFVKEVINKNGTHQILPKDYKYFGTDNPKQTLQTLVKNNPFYASCLVRRDGGYSINSYDPDNKSPSFFLRCVNLLSDDYYRVNANFTKNIELENICICIKGVEKEKSEERQCLYLLWLISYYAQVVHAIYHIWNWLLITGMSDSICEFESNNSLRVFGKAYVPNVSMKNEQVDLLLIGKNGALSGKIFNVKDGKEVRKFARELLVILGRCATIDEFFSSFLLKETYNNGIDELKNDGILIEYFKHMELIPKYAKDLTTEFKKTNNGEDVLKVEYNLEIFFNRCGPNMLEKCKTVETWISMITALGISHSCTMSYTRAMITRSGLSVWTDIDTFSDLEVSIAGLCSGTLVGTEEHHTVFYNSSQNWKGMNPLIMNIMRSFKGISSNYKREYFEKISKDQKELCENGWLLSDFFPDGVDGKQFTLTSYI